MGFKLFIVYNISILALGIITSVSADTTTYSPSKTTDPSITEETAASPSSTYSTISEPITEATTKKTTSTPTSNSTITDPSTGETTTEKTTTSVPSTQSTTANLSTSKTSTEDTTSTPPSTYSSTTDSSTNETTTDKITTSPPSTHSTTTNPSTSKTSAEGTTSTPPSTYSSTTDPSTNETTTEEVNTTQIPLAFADYINICTKNLLGINCIVKNVNNLQSVTENFQYDISLCSTKVQRQTSAILDKISELESYATKIDQANNKICKNANFKSKSDAAKIPSAKCVKNITNNVNKFNENLDITHNKVSTLLDKTTNGCASMSLLKLKLRLENFSKLIKECAEMADNV